MCMFCKSLFVLLYFFLLTIVLSVLLRYTDSDYLFGIFIHLFNLLVMMVGTDCVSQYKSNKDTMKAKKALLMISNFFSFHGDI